VTDSPLGQGKILWISNSITDRDGVTLTASSAVSGFGVERLQDMRPGHRWRASTANDESVQIDAGSGNTFDVDTAAVVGHPGTVDGAVTLDMSDQSDMASPVLTPAAYELWPPVAGAGDQLGLYMGGYPRLTDFANFTPFRVIRLGAMYTARYFRQRVTDPNIAQWEQGRLMAGIGYQMGRHVQTGWEIKRVDPSIVKRTFGGGVLGNRLKGWREMTVSIAGLAYSELLIQVDDLIRTVGRTKPVLCLMWPDATLPLLYRTAFYGLLGEDVTITGRWSKHGAVARVTVTELV